MNSPIITIGREYGSGGRYIGRAVAERLEIPFYDRELIDLEAKESGLSVDYLQDEEEKTTSLLFNIAVGGNNYTGKPQDEEYHWGAGNIFVIQSRVIRQVAEKGPCVIIGRCADYVLQEREDCFNVFILSDPESKKRRAIAYYGLDADTAEAELQKMDKRRARHYRKYTEQTWGDSRNYHLTLHSGFVGAAQSVETICAIAKSKMAT